MPTEETAKRVSELLPQLKLCIDNLHNSTCKSEWLQAANEIIDIYQEQYHPEETPRALRDMGYLQEVYLFFTKDSKPEY